MECQFEGYDGDFRGGVGGGVDKNLSKTYFKILIDFFYVQDIHLHQHFNALSTHSQ